MFFQIASNIQITQTKSTGWTTGTQKFSQWAVTIQNTGPAIPDVSLSFSSSLTDFWEIVQQSSGI